MGHLNGKTILVVGAAGGLGRAFSETCADAGANLMLWDAGCSPDGSGHDPSVVEGLHRELALRAAERTTGGRLAHASHRVESCGAVQAVMDQTAREFGGLDGVVFTAGGCEERPLLRMTDDALQRVIDVQLLAAIRICRESALLMSQADGGSIVLATGSMALFGVQRQSSQCAATAALAGFCRAAALDLRRHSVRLNMIAALARTRQTEHLPMFGSIRSDSMTPEQVAQTALFLLGDHSKHVTGEILGTAGSRLYGIRLRETPGHFFEGDFSDGDVGDALSNALRT